MATPCGSLQQRKRLFFDENEEFDPDNISLNGAIDSEILDSSESSDVSCLEETSDVEMKITGETAPSEDVNWNTAPDCFIFTGNPGILIELNKNCTELDIFEKFFDQEMIDLIATETNRFAAEAINASEIRPGSRLHKWTVTCDNEIRVFLGVLILQSVISKPNLESYWSKRAVVETPIFGKVMSRDRFFLIMKFLHFSNRETETIEDCPNPKLRKLYKVIESLRQKFCSFYLPQKDVSIDENLLLYEGRLGWKEFIPIKRARFGIKFYKLSESESGYICDFIIHTGQTTVYNEKYSDYGQSTRIVLHLMDRLLGKGYCVTIDNYYMSSELTALLIAQNTGIYGTMKRNRKNLPKELGSRKLAQEEIVAVQRNKDLAMEWQVKKEAYLLSTVHDTSMVTVENQKEEQVLKLEHEADFNHVNHSNQELSFHPSTRQRQKKYYKKIFRYLMDMALWNAFILHSKTAEKKTEYSEFRISIAEQIFEKYFEPKQTVPKGRPSNEDNPIRLTARHFPSHIPANPVKKDPKRQCKVCCSKRDESGKKIRKETRIWCADCEVGLCLEPCFRVYHTKKNY